MSEQLPERVPSVDILIETQRGPELHTFTADNTLVRTFDPEWAHMNYIFQQDDSMRAPRIIYGFPDMQEYLIMLGFQEKHHDGEPEDADKNMYIEYGRRRVENEL